MEPKITFRELFSAARKDIAYAVEGAIIEFTEQIVTRMVLMDVKRTELAGKIDASPQYVTKILNGTTNFTIETMVKVADALESDLRVQLLPRDRAAAWLEFAQKLTPTRPTELVAYSNMRSARRDTSAFAPPVQSEETPDESNDNQELAIAT